MKLPMKLVFLFLNTHQLEYDILSFPWRSFFWSCWKMCTRRGRILRLQGLSKWLLSRGVWCVTLLRWDLRMGELAELWKREMVVLIGELIPTKYNLLYILQKEDHMVKFYIILETLTDLTWFVILWNEGWMDWPKVQPGATGLLRLWMLQVGRVRPVQIFFVWDFQNVRWALGRPCFLPWTVIGDGCHSTELMGWFFGLFRRPFGRLENSWSQTSSWCGRVKTLAPDGEEFWNS